MKTIKLLLPISLFTFFYTCKAQQAQVNIANEIIATWIAEDDPKVKLIFNSNNQCLDYYDNVLSDTFTYSISHQCGTESDLNTWFLKLINQEDLDERCYEIYGANVDNNNTLSMKDLKSGKIFIYNKQ